MRRLAARAALALPLLLAACAGGSALPPHRYFVLATDGAAPAPAARAASAATSEATLLVAPTVATAFYDTQEIVFSRSTGTREYYRFSSWTEPPSRALASMLVARLEQGGAFRNVVPATSGARSSLLLHTQLEELYHDATAPPGVARVTLAAELSDPAKGALLGRRTFTATAPAASYDADGAVSACRQAVATLLDEVVAWVVVTSSAR
jgi:cholesterol transport system auxiliary component